MDAEEVLHAFTTLLNRLDVLAHAKRPGGTLEHEAAKLVYRIFLVRELKTKWPPLYYLRNVSLNRKEKTRNIEQNEKEAFIEDIQRQIGLAEEDQSIGRFPSKFSHYDRNLQRRGWIVIGLSRALVAGVDDGQARILANLLQGRDIDRSGRKEGIVPDRYEDVLGRVALWNGTQDIAETVSQLGALVQSGQKSIDGQALLNFALAAIGTLLAIIALPHQISFWQICSLGLIVMASLLFWRYSRNVHPHWLSLGMLIIVVALVLFIVSSWPCAILHFLPQFLKNWSITLGLSFGSAPC